ncbi:MAG: hypothetical protein P4L73_12220 [Caulobacteraceae bacterium]|nr:hypothetical protein [Caulobacteraceae bacterium]
MTVPTARRRPALNDDEETLETLARLGELQCTPAEAALVFKVSEARMNRFLAKRRPREAFETARGRGLEALRRAQLKLAETNATMAIFLGKTYLGQAERRELEQSGAIDVSQASQRVRDKLAALAAESMAQGDRRSRQ